MFKLLKKKGKKIKKQKLFFVFGAIIIIGVVFFVSYTFSQSGNRAVLDISFSSDNYDPATKTFYDRSGEGNHGVSINNTSFSEGMYSKVDGAANFNGTGDQVKINNLVVSSPSALTISAWFKKESGGDTFECVLHQAPNYTIGAASYWMGVDNADYLTATIGANTGVGWAAGKTNIKAEYGKWYHLLATWDGSVVKVYINGILEKQYNLSTYTNLTVSTRIGASTDVGQYWFKGAIGSVKILNYSLSENEVKELYNSERPVTASSPLSSDGLIGHWSVDSGKDNLYTKNIAPYADFSNRNYGQEYNANCWGGDQGVVYFYKDGGYNNLPYKKLVKTAGGTGGCYLDDHGSFTIENNKTYIISAWLKANRNESVLGYAIDINRVADNKYRIGPTINLTTEWQRYSWVYNSGADHEGIYKSRHIIYNDNDLPLEVYWSGFQVQEGSELTPFVNGVRDSKLTDSSSNGNHGTIIGSVFTTDRFGKAGGAMQFNGVDSRISINYKNSIKETSVSAWFKKTGTPAGGYHIIVGGSNVEISIPTAGQIRTGVTTNTQGRKVFNSGSGLTDGNWHHVGMTYDGVNLKSFIDGQLTATNPVSGDLVGTAGEIGRFLSNSYVANGSIDDVRIYNRALSEEEIKFLYDSYSPKTTTGSLEQGLILDMPLKSKYTKSETAGSQIMTDRTAYSRDGQNSGATITEEGASFDGVDDYIYVPPLGQTQSFSFNIWIKPTSNPTQNVASFLYASDSLLRFSIIPNSLIPQIRWRTSDGNYHNYQATSNAPLNDWTNIGAVYDGENKELKLFNNGVLETEFSDVDMYSLFGNHFMNIGRNATNSQYFNGQISNLLIYNRALSEDEVKTLYNRGRSDVGIMFQTKN